MRKPSPSTLRVVFTIIALVSAGTLVASYATADASVDTQAANGSGSTGAPTLTDGSEAASNSTETAGVAPSEQGEVVTIKLESRINRSNVTQSRTAPGELTVVATQGFYVSDENAELVAFSESGEVVYHDATYRVYFDVDPVPGERYTVEYVAAKHLDGEACEGVGTSRCSRNVVNRVNLTTGEETRVYAEVTSRIYSARWHDVDRLNATHLVVADIVSDGVYAVDTRDGEVAWRWNASRIYTSEMGGEANDWTHINDVELLDDGRVMVSNRNMDQVIFLEPDGDAMGGNATGWHVNESWSLGTDDDHSVLYEQHNPDYIPSERGGPAVLVGDSENNRIVEYQRENGTWNTSWIWKDAQLQWPRDADRLPNDNTLIVDSHGDRVVEVRPSGEIVWSVTIGMPYDAERLGTGDESAGGESIRAIRVRSDASQSSALDDLLPGGREGEDTTVTRPEQSFDSRFWLALKELTPSLVVNGVLYASPSWVRFTDLVFGFVLLGTVLCWTALELRWSRLSVSRVVKAVRTRLR